MMDSTIEGIDTHTAAENVHSSKNGTTGGQRSLRNLFTHPALLFGIVVLAALSIRVLHHRQAMLSPLMRPPLPIYDSQFYDEIARQIAHGDMLGKHAFFMAPAYQYLLAITYRYISDSLGDALLVQSIFGALTCGLLFWAGYLLAGRIVGGLTGLIAAFYGLFIYYDCLLMPNSAILGLHAMLLVTLLLTARRPTVVRWLAVGILLGLCAMAHGSALLLLPGVLIWIWILCQHNSLKKKSLYSLVVLASWAAVVGVVSIRNYVVSGDCVLLTTNAGMNLYIGNNPYATGTFVKMNFPEKGAHLVDYLSDFESSQGDMTPARISKRYRNKALTFICNHPRRTIALIAKKLMLLFNANELFVGDQFYFFKRYSSILRLPLPTFGLIAPIGLVGLVYSLPRWRKFFPVYVVLLSQVLTYTFTFVLARYRLVMVSCLILMAAVQFVWWIDRLREKQIRRIIESLICLTVAALVVNYTIPGMTSQRGYGQQHTYVARAYLREGDYQQAEVNYNAAMEADFSPYTEPQRQLHIVGILEKMAIIYQQTHRRPMGIKSLQKAMSILDSIHGPPALKDAKRRELKRLLDDATHMP